MKISHESLPKAYGYAKLNEQGDKQKSSGSIIRGNSGHSRTRDTVEIGGAKGAVSLAHRNTYRNINDLDTGRMVRFTRMAPEEPASQTESEAGQAESVAAKTAENTAQASAAGTTAANAKSKVDVGSLNISQIEADIRKELEKDADFMKANGLDFELVLKGRTYEKVSELTDEDHVNITADSYFPKSTITIGGKGLPFHIPDENNPGSYKAVDRDSDEAKAYANKAIEDRGKANDEYAKYKEMKAAYPDGEAVASAAGGESTVDIGSINIAQLEDDTREELAADADFMKKNGLDFELVLMGRLCDIISKMTGTDYVDMTMDWSKVNAEYAKYEELKAVS